MGLPLTDDEKVISESHEHARPRGAIPPAPPVGHRGLYIRAENFTRVKELGAGAMGNVSLVTSTSGKKYALKQNSVSKMVRLIKEDPRIKPLYEAHKNAFLSGESNKNEWLSGMVNLLFLNEVTLHGRASQSPFVATLENNWTEGGVEGVHDHYMLLENCAGGTLGRNRNRIRKSGDDAVRYYIRAIAQGLADCHSMGILYRDVHMENVVLRANGVPAWIDFGLAVECSSGEEVPGDDMVSTNLRTIKMRGLNGYTLSPEIRADLKNCTYSQKDDSWALGALFYELLLGGNAYIDLVDATDNDDIQALLSSVCPQAADAISGLLRFERDERSTVSKFLEHDWFKGMSWDPEVQAGVRLPRHLDTREL